jgi:uncharacterized protein (UPF0297 family)
MYKKGATIIAADALSRQPNHTGNDEENEAVAILPLSVWLRQVLIDVQDQICTYTNDDPTAKLIRSNLDAHQQISLRRGIDNWKFIDGLLYSGDQLYIPDNHELRHLIIKDYHDSPSAGHPGRF